MATIRLSVWVVLFVLNVGSSWLVFSGLVTNLVGGHVSDVISLSVVGIAVELLFSVGSLLFELEGFGVQSDVATAASGTASTPLETRVGDFDFLLVDGLSATVALE